MNTHSTPVKSYSPFWAICLVFATLIFLQVKYVVDDFNQRSQIKATREQEKNLVGSAQNISLTLELVGRELVALAATSAEASNIVTEFKIQINKPAEAPK